MKQQTVAAHRKLKTEVFNHYLTKLEEVFNGDRGRDRKMRWTVIYSITSKYHTPQSVEIHRNKIQNMLTNPSFFVIHAPQCIQHQDTFAFEQQLSALMHDALTWDRTLQGYNVNKANIWMVGPVIAWQALCIEVVQQFCQYADKNNGLYNEYSKMNRISMDKAYRTKGNKIQKMKDL